MSKIFEQLLKKRGFSSDFLSPSYEKLADPFILPDMEKAIARLKTALKDHEKVLIYGDYDVDGVTASTLMEEALKLAGFDPENLQIMLPDRFADGYGMSPRLIKRAEKEGISLVITVDCGSRNHSIIDELNLLKIDSIITDHHETDEVMPNSVALVNPKRKDAPVKELENLAGVGVAFKVAEALVKAGLIPKNQEKWLLDLVLLGTICDSMSLVGENRIFGFYGLKVLEKTRRAGLKELMKNAHVKELNSESIGFQIGPRLNAAGRLETADLALDLLRSRSPARAAALAKKLEELNKKRKTEQLSALKSISDRGVKDDPVIIEAGKWHEGILGIVAGRLVETYKKPSFVLSEVESGVLKGSGRSFGDFNLAKALDFAKDAIISGGGHAGAAGVRLSSEKLYDFREKINAYYESLSLKNQEKLLNETADLELDDFSELTLDFLTELKTLEPFGGGNEEPIFGLKNVRVASASRIGPEKQHLRLDLLDAKNRPLKLLAFYPPETWLSLDYENIKIEPLVRFIENDFQGVKTLEARICDIIAL
ncbi:single-stranded-DNA-specific exonuclease RecJ [Candidatus Saccharibacteria bacterium]|nr:single-stranded-DNA-specific exonuclease RecJ [Candidatus Saccharibacteria bacterium]